MRSHLGFISSNRRITDPDRAIFVEGGMIAETAEEEFEALRFDDRLGWRVINHEVSKVGLDR